MKEEEDKKTPKNCKKPKKQQLWSPSQDLQTEIQEQRLKISKTPKVIYYKNFKFQMQPQHRLKSIDLTVQ